MKLVYTRRLGHTRDSGGVCAICARVRGVPPPVALRMPSIPFEDMVKLATLPCLTALTLVKGIADRPLMVSPPTRDNSFDSRPQNAFGSLKFLHLELPGTLGDCIPLISSFSFPAINCLLVAVSLPSFACEVDQLSKLIRDNCSHDTLHSVRITTGYGPKGITDASCAPVSPEVVRRLFCFRNIIRLELTTKLSIVLDDADLQELAASWPHLERLEIASSAPREAGAPGRRATMRGLAHLARHCPWLSALAISLDVRVEDLYLPRAEHRNSTLWTVSFYRSPVAAEDAQRVGAFLYALFPQLVYFDGDPVYDQPEDRANWELVREAIARCKQGLVDVPALLVGCLRAFTRDVS